MALFSSDSSKGASPASSSPSPSSPASRLADASGFRNGMSVPGIAAPPPPPSDRQAYLVQMRVRLHQKLVERLNVQNLRSMPINVVRQECRNLIRELYQNEKGLLTSAEQEKLMDDVMDETFGLGPLEALLKDPSITDILVNRYDRIYVERKGQLELVDIQFRDNAHLRQIIDRIVVQVGRRVDEVSPMVDARLTDGSRVNAIIPPLALDGPAMSIRRFGHNPLTIEDLITHGSIPPMVIDFLAAAVQARCNLVISGGTGSGKTTLLNCLSKFIPIRERVITIEDAAELQLQQPHVVRLETRPPNIEGSGEVTQRDLVKNSLRMRPDRIIIGEVRSAEALDMLQAMNTGHEGSMTTIHANSVRDALTRLEVTVSMAGFDIPIRALRHQIASAVHLMVQVQRLMGGKRRVTTVSEITGMEGESIQMHDLFVFEQTGADEHGNAQGRFISTGIRPRLADRIEHHGMRIRQEWFQRRVIQ